MKKTCNKITQILLSPAQVTAFRKKIRQHYRSSGRDLPWRKTRSPYHVLVSEIMLQQTPVSRVLVKYPEFLESFPDVSSLAKARLPKLLKIWSGLGYNRRALALRSLARKVLNEHRGVLPSETGKLIELPGVGKYTACAIACFAFNAPEVFMDTNIRRVYIHEFFSGGDNIHDDQIRPLIGQTLDTRDPRKWYNALMDYGTTLRQAEFNPNRRSAHYARQSPFENSNRQVRGSILKALLGGGSFTTGDIARKTGVERERVMKSLVELEKEGFILKNGRRFTV